MRGDGDSLRLPLDAERKSSSSSSAAAAGASSCQGGIVAESPLPQRHSAHVATCLDVRELCIALDLQSHA